jgi:hypothetical protein
MSIELKEKIDHLTRDAWDLNLTLIEYAYIKLLMDQSNTKVIIGPAKLEHLLDAIASETKWRALNGSMSPISKD